MDDAFYFHPIENRIRRWGLRCLIVIAFVALLWIVEERYGLLTGTDMRLRPVAFQKTINANGQSSITISFDNYAYKDTVRLRLEFSSAPGKPQAEPVFSPIWCRRVPLDWESLCCHAKHIWKPFNGGLSVEVPASHDHPSECCVPVGQTVRLKRGMVLKLAKFVRIERDSNGVSKEVPDELLLFVR